MDKDWLDSTDWAALSEGVAKGDGTRLRPVKPSKLHF
jgi:hypothetical protein